MTAADAHSAHSTIPWVTLPDRFPQPFFQLLYSTSTWVSGLAAFRDVFPTTSQLQSTQICVSHRRSQGCGQSLFLALALKAISWQGSSSHFGQTSMFSESHVPAADCLFPAWRCRGGRFPKDSAAMFRLLCSVSVGVSGLGAIRVVFPQPRASYGSSCKSVFHTSMASGMLKARRLLWLGSLSHFGQASIFPEPRPSYSLSFPHLATPWGRFPKGFRSHVSNGSSSQTWVRLRCFPSCFHSNVPAAVLHVILYPIPRWHQGCGEEQVPLVSLRLTLMAPLYTIYLSSNAVCLPVLLVSFMDLWCAGQFAFRGRLLLSGARDQLEVNSKLTTTQTSCGGLQLL